MHDEQQTLKPIGLLGSVLYFGIPAVVFTASILGLLPWMIRRGFSHLTVFNVTFAGPLALMLGAVFVFYRLEGRPWSWPAVRDRLRLQRPPGSTLLWTLGLVLVTPLLSWLLTPLVRLASRIPLYDPPPEVLAFMGGLQGGAFGEMAMQGRWDVFAWVLIGLLVFNIGGEELWWRGVILPRQERAFGRWAWLVNGLLWDLFHIFYHSTAGGIVAYLPSTVPLAYVAQRTRSTWPGIIAHLIGNSPFAIAVFRSVVGE